jgi:hypothetical protein
VEVLAQARIAALQARADEALTLVARGSGGGFEEDFKTNFTKLAGEDGRGGLLARAQNDATDPVIREALGGAVTAANVWRLVHLQLRGLDDTGQYPEAVRLAIGGDTGSAATAFNVVDDRLALAIATANRAFTDRADSAGGALVGAGFGWTVLTIVLVAGVVVGLQQRIAEYR